MYTKKNMLIGLVVGIVAVLSIAVWCVSAEWTPDLGERLDGSWVVRIPTPTTVALHNITFVAQDSLGLRYTAVVEHSQCSESVFGMFPAATYQSQSVGLAVKTGPDTVAYTLLGHGVNKRAEPDQEVVYYSIISGSAQLTKDGLLQTDASIAYYAAQQDANRDGFPDEGQKPLVCALYPLTMKRVQLMPPCQPTPLPTAQK